MMPLPRMPLVVTVAPVLAFLCAGPTLAQPTPAARGAVAQATATRLIVTEYRVKPDMVDEWLTIQRNEVVPALRKAGVQSYTVYETVVGDATAFTTLRPMPTFAELGTGDPLAKALGAEGARYLEGKLRLCADSISRHIENRQDEFYLDPGDATALFASTYRALPGRSADYMRFIRAELFPVMRQAQDNGTFAGLSVTLSAQGGEPGIITLNMHYDDFTGLDGPPPVAKTLGPEGTREFLTKGVGLIEPVEQRVLRRLRDLSF